jgi:hypothetical protein
MVTQQEIRTRNVKIAQPRKNTITNFPEAQTISPQEQPTYNIPEELFSSNDLQRLVDFDRETIAKKLEAQARTAEGRIGSTSDRREQRMFQEIVSRSREAATAIRSGTGVITNREAVNIVAKSRYPDKRTPDLRAKYGVGDVKQRAEQGVFEKRAAARAGRERIEAEKLAFEKGRTLAEGVQATRSGGQLVVKKGTRLKNAKEFFDFAKRDDIVYNPGKLKAQPVEVREVKGYGTNSSNTGVLSARNDNTNVISFTSLGVSNLAQAVPPEESNIITPRIPTRIAPRELTFEEEVKEFGAFQEKFYNSKFLKGAREVATAFTGRGEITLVDNALIKMNIISPGKTLAERHLEDTAPRFSFLDTAEIAVGTVLSSPVLIPGFIAETVGKVKLAGQGLFFEDEATKLATEEELGFRVRRRTVNNNPINMNIVTIELTGGGAPVRAEKEALNFFPGGTPITSESAAFGLISAVPLVRPMFTFIESASARFSPKYIAVEEGMIKGIPVKQGRTETRTITLDTINLLQDVPQVTPRYYDFLQTENPPVVQPRRFTVTDTVNTVDITLAADWTKTTEPLTKQVELAGQEVVGVSGARGFFGFLEKSKKVDKPDATGLEQTFFIDPRARLRTSRLGLKEETASPTDILGGNFQILPNKPQAILFPRTKIADFPASMKDIQVNLQRGTRFSESQKKRLYQWQLEKTGEFKPIGYLSVESEATLAPGEVIVGRGTAAVTLIEGKRVPIIEAAVMDVKDVPRNTVVLKAGSKEALETYGLQLYSRRGGKPVLAVEKPLSLSSRSTTNRKLSGNFVTSGGTSSSTASTGSTSNFIYSPGSPPSSLISPPSRPSSPPSSLISPPSRPSSPPSSLISPPSRPSSPPSRPSITPPYKERGDSRGRSTYSDLLRKVPEFAAFLKERGAFREVGRGSRIEALSFGSEAALSSLGATFQIRKTGRSVKPKDVQPRVNLKDYFRDYRIKGGKKIALEDTFIQKRNKRLSTSFERKAIQKARGNKNAVRTKNNSLLGKNRQGVLL